MVEGGVSCGGYVIEKLLCDLHVEDCGGDFL